MTFLAAIMRKPAIKKKKDALVSAFRRDPPKPEMLNLNVNLNVGGVLTLKVEQAPPPPDQSLRAVFTAKFEGFTVKGDAPMAYTLPDDKDVPIKVSFKDAKGNPVDLPEGNVTWETSDDMIVNVGAKEGDDQSAMLHPGQNLGNAQITCTAKNDDGTEIIATLDVTVVAGDAVTGTIEPEGESKPNEQSKQQRGGGSRR